MKSICLFLVLFSWLEVTHASQNVNHLSCIYFHRYSTWEFYGAQYSSSKFDLKAGESKMLVGGWTSERPSPPNYAVCNMVIGSDDDHSVEIKSVKFEGKVIETIGDNCDVKGTDVKLISEESMVLERGSYSEMESDWLTSPEPDKIKIRTYFPTISEIDHIADISKEKCAELAP